MIVLLSVIYFVNYANEICFELWIILKNGKVGLPRKRDNMIQIQDMFENGKPDIVLKTVKGFNLKKLLLSF